MEKYHDQIQVRYEVHDVAFRFGEVEMTYLTMLEK